MRLGSEGGGHMYKMLHLIANEGSRYQLSRMKALE